MKQETAIERIQQSKSGVWINSNTVYATYTSGRFNNFYATEQEAIEHCSNPLNGCKFNEQWFQDRYTVYSSGQLCCSEKDEAVYVSDDCSRYLTEIGGKWQMPFVKWQSL